jgi:hypothetical protein
MQVDQHCKWMEMSTQISMLSPVFLATTDVHQADPKKNFLSLTPK